MILTISILYCKCLYLFFVHVVKVNKIWLWLNLECRVINMIRHRVDRSTQRRRGGCCMANWQCIIHDSGHRCDRSSLPLAIVLTRVLGHQHLYSTCSAWYIFSLVNKLCMIWKTRSTWENIALASKETKKFPFAMCQLCLVVLLFRHTQSPAGSTI
jgi:hypothetical protein